MSKARDLANLISTGNALSDGAISVSEISDLTASAAELNKLDGLNASTAELNHLVGATSSVQTQLDNISVTSGSLTKTFTQNETADITLSQSITSAPVVSATKEVPQTGVSTKGNWDVNSTASNYDFHNTAANVTLTPTTAANSDITTLTYSSVNDSVSGSDTQAIHFSTDGTKLYASNGGSSGTMYQHTLSTAWDITTRSQSATFSHNSQLSNGRGMYWKPDGTRFWLVGNSQTCFQYDINSSYPWNLSYASYTSGSNINISSQHGTGSQGITFKPDGTKMFIVDYTNHHIGEWALSTAWDITTASHTRNAGVVNTPKDIVFNSDGTVIYIVTASKITEYNCSTPYDLSTMSTPNRDVTIQQTSNQGLYLRSNDTEMYAVAQDVVYKYTFPTTNVVALGSGSFASTDVGKRIVGNGGDVILTATSGTYSTTGGSAFTDNSTIAAGSWSMFGLKSAGDADGITMSGIAESYSLNNAAYSNVSYNTSNAGSDQREMFISPDGQYLFISNTGNNLARFVLSTPYDITTAGNYDQLFDMGTMNGINTTIQAFTFSTNGQQLLALDGNGNLARTYFSTGYSLSGGSNQTSSTMSTSYGINLGLAVSSDGLTFFAASGSGYIHTKTFASAYNLGSSVSGTANFQKGTEGDGSTGSRFEAIRVSSDGKKAFVAMGAGATPQILRYDMTTANDISTMSYANELLDISSETQYPTGLAFNSSDEGQNIVMLSRSDSSGNTETTIREYSMGSNVQPTSQYHVAVTNSGGQIDSQYFTDINSMTAAESTTTGTAHYAVSTDGRTTWSVAKGTDGVRPIVRNNSGTWQYNNDGGTTSNYQLTSPTYVQNKFIGTSNVYGLFMKPDGTRLYYMQYSGGLYQWNLSTAYDVSTATYSNISNTSAFSSLSNFGTGLYFKNDGTYMYITSIGNNVVTRFTLSTAWDISTLGSAQSMSPNATAVASNLQDLDFKTDGTVMYLVTNSKVHAYNLSTAWDLSTVSSTSPDVTFTLTNLGSSGQAIRFKSDGTEFYVLDSSGSDIIIYSLSTAWDLSTASYSSTFSNSQSITTGRSLALSSDGMKMYIADEAGSARTYEYTIGSSAYGTGTTWVNGTTNDELYTLQEALGAQSHNRMDKTQLDAVADANHFTLGNSLDLMIALRMDTAASTLPTSDGVTLNYDAAALNEGAVLGTDYDFFFPANNKVQIKSLAAQNLKVRVV